MKAWLVKKDEWVDGDIHSEGFRYVFGSRHRQGIVRQIYSNGTVSEGSYLNDERHGLHRVIIPTTYKSDLSDTTIEFWVAGQL